MFFLAFLDSVVSAATAVLSVPFYIWTSFTTNSLVCISPYVLANISNGGILLIAEIAAIRHASLCLTLKNRQLPESKAFWFALSAYALHFAAFGTFLSVQAGVLGHPITDASAICRGMDKAPFLPPAAKAYMFSCLLYLPASLILDGLIVLKIRNGFLLGASSFCL